MSRRTPDIAALGERIKAGQRPSDSADVDAGDRPAARTRPFRQTVDLPPELNTALQTWRLEAALQLGRPRLSNQDVLATLVAALVADDTIARRVRARLERGH